MSSLTTIHIGSANPTNPKYYNTKSACIYKVEITAIQEVPCEILYKLIVRWVFLSSEAYV